jgi:flavodoxin I
MKSLILYDSYFGCTEKIAKSIENSLQNYDKVELCQIRKATQQMLEGLNFLIIGSPTRGFRPSKSVIDFLNSIPSKSLKGVKAASFDTRIELETIKSGILRYIVDKSGYAAKTISKTLKKKGAEIIAAPEGFIVTGEQGPLKEGEIERAREWAKNLR